MTTLGWIIFGVVCLILIAVLAVLKFVKHFRTLPLVVAAMLAIAIGVGAYFGAKTIFGEKVEEPVIEEVVEEATTKEG